jgi:hypothetical protein
MKVTEVGRRALARRGCPDGIGKREMMGLMRALGGRWPRSARRAVSWGHGPRLLNAMISMDRAIESGA